METKREKGDARNHCVSLEHRAKGKIIKAFKKGSVPGEEKNKT